MAFVFLIAIWELFSLSTEFSGGQKKQESHEKYVATFSGMFHFCLRTFVNNVKTMPEILIENVSLRLPIASSRSGWPRGKQRCQCSCIYIWRAKSKCYFHDASAWITLRCFGKFISADQGSLSFLRQATSCTALFGLKKSCISSLNTNKTVTLNRPSANTLFSKEEYWHLIWETVPFDNDIKKFLSLL